MRQLVLVISVALAALVLAGTAAAATTHSTSFHTEDVTGTVLTCPNENVVFSGSITVLETSTLVQLPTGFQSSGSFLFNFDGVTATGQTSGTVYRVVGVTATGFSFSFGGFASASVSRFVQTWLLIPSGGGEPLSFHEVLNVVYDANGALVAVVFQGPADCN
jgi:hypothetical protein